MLFEKLHSTPLYWSPHPRIELKRRCVGYEALAERVYRDLGWSERSNIDLTFVSGLTATRESPDGLEVLLVRGGGKSTWQFAGGKFDGGKGDTDHYETFIREIKEELGQDVPDTVTYQGTYVQRPTNGHAFAIHNFRLDNCTWTEEELNRTMGSDANEVEWTANPFYNRDGTERALFPQVRHMLIKMGFTPPRHEPDDDYDGDPNKL